MRYGRNAAQHLPAIEASAERDEQPGGVQRISSS
jgi:hypothetical protein